MLRPGLTIVGKEDEAPGEGREEGDVPGLDDEVVEHLGSSDGPTPGLPGPLLHLLLKDPASSGTGNDGNRNLGQEIDQVNN